MIITEINKQATTSVEIHPLLKKRWSPRVFSDTPISDQHFQQLLEALRWAASSMNEQPWRIIYGHKGTTAYDKIFDCFGEFNQKWADNATTLLLAGYKKNFSSGKENFHALHDLGLGMSNLTIQAQSLNITVHQMAGIDWKKAHKVYGVPENYHIATGIALGYYGGNAADLPSDLEEQELSPRKRKSIEEIAQEGKFPQ